MNVWHFAAKQLHIVRITASLSDFLAEVFLHHLVKWVVEGIYFLSKMRYAILIFAVKQRLWVPTTYRKVPKFPDFGVISLKFKKRGLTFGYFIKKIQME